MNSNDRYSCRIGEHQGTLALLLLLLTPCASGCQADPPTSSGQRSAIPVSEQRYASLATCTPFCQAGQCSPSCTGLECAQQLVTGAPDGRPVVLGAADCHVLDLAFNGGTIAPRRAITDLIIHVGRVDDGVRVFVEASATGLDYQLVGWINGAPPNTTSVARCSARQDGDRVLIDLSAGELDAGCNSVQSASHLRLSIEEKQAVGPSIEIDAVEVEPCSFRPSGQPSDESCTGTITNPIPGDSD